MTGSRVLASLVTIGCSVTLLGLASCSKCAGGENGLLAAGEWKVGTCLKDESPTIYKIKEVKNRQYNVAQLVTETGAEAGTLDVEQERFSTKEGFKKVECPAVMPEPSPTPTPVPTPTPKSAGNATPAP